MTAFKTHASVTRLRREPNAESEMVCKLPWLQGVVRLCSMRVLLMFVCMVALVVACTPEPPIAVPPGEPVIALPPDEPQEKPADEPWQPKAVFSPAYTHYNVHNPVSIEKVPPNASWDVDEEVYIQGLKDKEVEDRINDNLRALYADIRERDVPPYRGIRVVIPEGSDFHGTRLRARVTYNSNNIVSIHVWYSRNYTPPGARNYIHLNGSEARTFSLESGRELTLSHLFTDDADYLNLLSTVVQEECLAAPDEGDQGTYWSARRLKLISPFRGIRPEQVFYLQPGGITLIIDHRTPEFQVEFYATSVSVPLASLGDTVAIYSRFYEGAEDLYRYSRPRQIELVHAFHGFGGEVRGGHAEEEETYAYSASYVYPASSSATVRELVLRLYSSYEESVESFRRQGGGLWTLYYNVNASVYGPFTQVIVTEGINKLGRPLHGLDDVQWLEYSGEGYVRWRRFAVCLTQDDTELTLADIFCPGFDYVAYFREAFALQLGTDSYPLKNPPDFDDMLGGLQFALGSDSLRVWYPEYLETEEGRWVELGRSFSYGALGYNNLCILPGRGQ